MNDSSDYMSFSSGENRMVNGMTTGMSAADHCLRLTKMDVFFPSSFYKIFQIKHIHKTNQHKQHLNMKTDKTEEYRREYLLPKKKNTSKEQML